MFRPLTYITLLAAALSAGACSSDATLDDERAVDLRQPMVFGYTQTAAEREVTRAALETAYSDFKVGVWKAFDATAQQNVMDGYMVKHTATAMGGHTGTYNWYYEGLNGQLLRYWDLGAFPYDFRAVAPYSTDATISANGLSINATFQSQTLTGGTVSPASDAAEPCVAAHVTRKHEGTNYIDTDKLKGNLEINTTGKADATREVHMPFHHLVSKIGFRIYIDNPQPQRPEWNDNNFSNGEYEVWIEDITITLQKTTGLITSSSQYTATNAQGLLNGTWAPTTTTADEYTILQHGEYKENYQQNLHFYLNKETSYDLTPGCLLHIPQEGVKVRVQMHLETNHVETEEQHFYYDTWLSLSNTDADGDLFTWEPDNRYIYYLHVPNLHGHDIFLTTCEVLPWDEVQTTDIDVGL